MEKALKLKSDNNSKYIWKGEAWSYKEALSFQKTTVESYDSKPTFIASVHAPVFSVGKSMEVKESHINNIPLVPVERGGKAMFHGPGQLTIYPILKITDYFKGPKDYVCFLFCSLKDYFLKEHGIKLTSYDNGLWTIDEQNQPKKKVGFIGLRIKKGIAYHGFSLNYHLSLEHFKTLSPCNISGAQVGNLFEDSSINLKLESRKIFNHLVANLNHF